MSLYASVAAEFENQFDDPAPIVVRAPGRVNLIGDHTDYNDGFVLPMAIQMGIYIALRPRTDRRVRLFSLDFKQKVEIPLDNFERQQRGWSAYVQGVAWALNVAGYPLEGWEGVIAGDVPAGAGLSSSAALELACARAFSERSGFSWDPAQMALLAQKAENDWVGMTCGIMDQMVSAAGRAGHALLLDCRSLAARHLPLMKGAAVVVLDTGTRRGLVDSEYNRRRAECEDVARHFGLPALRDLTLEELQRAEREIDPVAYRRGRHVVTENARTLAAAESLSKGDPIRFGALMAASHASLREDFEVSSPALDRITAIAARQPGCFGARMTGAGFGGCAVALVERDRAADFSAAVQSEYARAGGSRAAIYVCEAVDGASAEPPAA